MRFFNFFDRFRASTSDRSPWGDFYFEPVSARSISGMRVSADSAMRLAAVYACVRILSETMASLPLVVWAERWEASIESDLLPDGDALEIEFDFANLMRGDAASRSAYYQSGIQNGWLTRNEARISENLNPIAGLDQPLRPLNMVEEDDAEDAEIESQDSDTDASPEPDPQLSLRLRKLVESNAQRLARRICKKGALGSNEINLIAQTFSLPPSAVQNWAQGAPSLEDEPALSRSLIQLGIHT